MELMDRRACLALAAALIGLMVLFGCAEEAQPAGQTPEFPPTPPTEPEPIPEETPEPTPTPIDLDAIRAGAAIVAEELAFDRDSVQVAIGRGGSAKAAITITNLSNEVREIPIAKRWPHENTTLTLSDSKPLLEAGESKSIELGFRADSEAEGTYLGSIKFVVSGAGRDKLVEIPLTLEIGAVSAEEETRDKNLAVLPEEYSFVVETGGSRSDTSSFEVCNNSGRLMGDVEFTLSGGDAGDWIESIPKTTGLGAGECKEKTLKITVPESTAIGAYIGAITVDSGTEKAALAVEVRVKGSADSFSFSWANAEFGQCSLDECRRIEGFKIENTDSENAITITGIQVSGWSARDKDSAKLSEIRLGPSAVWDGNAIGGQSIDLNGFEIRKNTSYNDCRLYFDNFVGNDSEEFTLSFEFSDGSIYTTETWPQHSGASSFRFSWATAKFARSGRNVADWTVENLNDTKDISIVRVGVSNWSSRDEDNAEISAVKLNDSPRWVGVSGTGEGWIDIANFDIPAKTAYSTGNLLTFTREVDNDAEQVIMEFGFSDGSTYKTTPWPDYHFADLWENDSDKPQPVDFSTDINAKANTFGLGAGNDGWDWSKDVYSTGDTCVRFNADPNDDNSPADSGVGSLDALKIEIGDWSDGCEDNGHGSGAYGIEFGVTKEVYDLIDAGGTAMLQFDWAFINHNLGNGDKAWVKVRLGNESKMNYLGVNKKGEGDDDSKEIFYAFKPSDDNGSRRINVSKYITSSGTHYLEFGAALSDWEDSEWLEVRFDNIDLVFRERD